jgi:pseudouridine synthase
MEEMRLQKYLALCSVASRRSSEEIILSGRVSVNGKIITELGTKVVPGDKVTVDGREIKQDNKKIYIMLNKPRGCVTTAEDDRGRQTVMDYVGDIEERIYPVGRLDYNTEGLIILTNDGELAYSLTHPKHEKEKVYDALVKGIVYHNAIEKLERGVYIDGKKTFPCKAEVIEHRRSSSVIRLTIHEGRNRQVRKMCDAISHSVIALRRVAVDGIELGNLETGKWRHLTKTEVARLKKV